MTLADVDAIVGMLVILIGAAGLWLQRRADARAREADAAKTRAEIGIVRAQVAPDTGPALTDWQHLTDRRLTELARSIGGIRDDQRLDRSDLQTHRDDASRIHADLARRLTTIEKRRKQE